MFLKFLGRGSAFNTREGNNSAYFIKGNVLNLIDCGEDTYSRIIKLDLLKDITDVNVIITHLHSDHIGSLSTLIHDCYWVKKIKVTIFTPIEALERILELMGNISASHYNLIIVKPSIYVGLLDGYTHIKFIKVKHKKEMQCYGVEIVINKDFRLYNIWNGDRDKIKRIWYSGDSSEINSRYFTRLNKRKIDEFYQDVCYNKFPNNPHTHYNKVIGKFNSLSVQDYRGRILLIKDKFFCMHIDDNKVIDILKNKEIGVVKVEDGAIYVKNNKEKLMDTCDEAIQKNAGLYVVVEMPDCNEPEVIINPSTNIDYKKYYYNKSYNQNLELIAFKKIKIIGFGLVTNEVYENFFKSRKVYKGL